MRRQGSIYPRRNHQRKHRPAVNDNGASVKRQQLALEQQCAHTGAEQVQPYGGFFGSGCRREAIRFPPDAVNPRAFYVEHEFVAVERIIIVAAVSLIPS